MITLSCILTVCYNLTRKSHYNYLVLNFKIHYFAPFQPVTHLQTNTAKLVRELLLMLKVLIKPSAFCEVIEKYGFSK
jgi:hypothetical protein